MLAAIELVADNGNIMYLVVGGDETVVAFDYAHRETPYYSSKGPTDADDPVLTAYLAFNHHTEFPRRSVIPMRDGLSAVYEFFETGELPACVVWAEV